MKNSHNTMLKNAVIFLLALVSSASLFACPENEIPLSVDGIETHRVGDNLVRIISYNTEMEPKLEIELLATPKLKLKKKLVINKVKLNNEVIDFTDSAGVFISDFQLKDEAVTFSVDYFYRKGSGELIMSCSVSAKNNDLSTPVCMEKE